MIIVVSSAAGTAPSVTLEEPDDCKGFHLEARGVDRNGVSNALRDSDTGSLSGEDAYITPQAVHRMAAGNVSDDWAERFAGMVGYAATKGWVAEDGSIQAHCVWA